MSYYDDDTIDQDSFDVKNYSLSTYDANNKLFENYSQFALFPIYTYSNGYKSKLRIQTDPIIMLEYSGIPRIDGRFRKHNNECMYFHIVFLKSDNGSIKLYNNVIHPIDSKNISEIIEKKNESKFACYYDKDFTIVPFKKNLIYFPMIKKIRNMEEDYEDTYLEPNYKNDKPTGDMIGRIKVRLDTEHDYDKSDNSTEDRIKTEVYIKQKNGTIVKKEIMKLDDLRKILKLGCKAEFELNFYKFWINKTNTRLFKKSIDKQYMCGMSIKCTKMLIHE